MARTTVQSELIATNAISGTIIADGAITSTHLAANSVDTAELVTGSIDTIHIAANNVTAAKIVSDGIETRHLHSNVISGLSAVTAASGDYVLIGDTSDSNNLKKALVSDFLSDGITASGSDTIIQSPDDTSILYVNNSGGVGIGTSSPARTLHVNSADANVASFEGHQGEGVVISSGTNGQIDIIGYDDGASSYNPILIRAATTGLYLDTSGNVGIGITTPNESGFGATSNVLSIAGTAQDAFGVLELISTDVTSSNRIGEIRFGNLDAGSSFASNAGIRATRDGADNSSALSLWYSNAGTFTEGITLKSDGKVGIGTTSPSHDLHVYHSTNASDTMIFADNLQTSQSGADYTKYGIVGQVRGAHASWSRGVGVSGLGDAATFHKAIGVYAGLNTTAISGFGYDCALYADGNDLGYAGTFMNGKVGIGTNAPNEPLTVRSSAENINTTLIEIGNDLHATNTKDAWIKFVCGAATNDYSWAAGAYPTDFRFSYLGARATAVATAANVRLQISNGGRLTYNDTGTDNGHGNFVGEVGSGYKALSFERTVGGGEVGSVVANASSTTYNTSSDYRLKENIDYSWDATTRLKQLKPARFNWIADDTNTLLEGFLAHEVSSIVPEAVSGEKDAMADPILYGDGDELPAGKKVGDVKKASAPDYQGIDHSKLVPLLVKTVQELEARIKTLEG